MTQRQRGISYEKQNENNPLSWTELKGLVQNSKVTKYDRNVKFSEYNG